MTYSRIFIALAFIGTAMPATAYIGPGSGISLLGGLWAVLVGIVLALAAILFWPVRMMIKRMRRNKQQNADAEQAAGTDANSVATTPGTDSDT